jgi:hypothetical protein
MEASIKRTFLEKGFIINAVADSYRGFGCAAQRAQAFGAVLFTSAWARCFTVRFPRAVYG